MKTTLIIFAICIVAAVLVAGCRDTGSSGGFFSSLTGSSGTGGSGTSGAVTGSSGSVSGSGGLINPEPATVALLGGGLIAFALLRRRKK